MATKALDVYMKIIGSEYLYETLHSLVEIIYASDENLEVDPARLAKQKLSNDQKDKLIKKNLGRLLMNVEAITYAIFKSVEKLPK